MNRRHFLTAIIASACAPAIVRASSLMPVRARTMTVYELGLWVAAQHEALRRELVVYQFGRPLTMTRMLLPSVTYTVSRYERMPLFIPNE